MNESIVPSFRQQIAACEILGSPLYAAILSAAADDIERDGVTAEILSGYSMDGARSAAALRLMGGLHRLVLTGRANDLAFHFPTVGGQPDFGSVGAAYIAAACTRTEYLRSALDIPPQTNEIGRSMLLFPGLASAIGRRSIPVHLREIGTSAGLNLVVDQFGFRTDVWKRGGADKSPVIESAWTGPTPAIPATINIESRAGCDLNPIDVSNADQRLRLLSFVWGDQVVRFERTRQAMDLLRRFEHRIDEADASSWLASELEHRPSGLLVVQHSVMWQYLPEERAASIEEMIGHHGTRATAADPLAWVRFEPGEEGPMDKSGFGLSVTTWPGGEARRLATGHPHGAWVDWHDHGAS